jgi:drug/metabolite transporter (DMT)-like permease
MGYISLTAGVLLWFLGLIITSTVVYLLYYAAIRYLSEFQASLLVAALMLAGLGILAFWGFALSRGVLSDGHK